MDTAATLSFFQTFYANTSLYVVAEPDPALSAAVETPPPAPVAAAGPSVDAPAPSGGATMPSIAVPASQAAVADPLLPAAKPSAPPPASISTLPSLGSLKTASAPTDAGHAPAPLPPVAPAPPRSEPQPAAAPETESAAYQPTNLTLAQLPAAEPAPPAQAGRIQPTPTQSPVAHVPFATLGSNAQGLVVLVRLSPDQFRKLPRNVFLNKLLQAIGLVMADVVLVNVEHEKYPVALCSLRQHLHARQFLAFGKNLLDVAVYTTQPYEPVLLYGDTAFLGAGEVEMLEYDAGRKKQLWQAIQRMFLA